MLDHTGSCERCRKENFCPAHFQECVGLLRGRMGTFHWTCVEGLLLCFGVNFEHETRILLSVLWGPGCCWMDCHQWIGQYLSVFLLPKLEEK